MPPTRAEVYKLLKKHLSQEKYAKIKRVKKLLGSGSIKYVVLVEYKDGNKDAVSIRRPFLDEKIEDVLDIVERWSQELKKDSELKAQYDFDYYLNALREQLALEVQFPKEREKSIEMAKLYEKIPSHADWKFVPVFPTQEISDSDQVLNFMAVEEAVPFSKLSKEDKKSAGELIVQTELSLMLEHGQFDADRHLGNYLFDPKTKSVYPIDMGQVYMLTPNNEHKPGDPYFIAKIIYGIMNPDFRQGAKDLADVFLKISDLSEQDQEAIKDKLLRAIEEVLQKNLSLESKPLYVLGELNRLRVHIPLRFSMGIIKGLMIVLNEEYAKAIDPSFIYGKIAPFVGRQLERQSQYEERKREDGAALPGQSPICENLLIR